MTAEQYKKKIIKQMKNVGTYKADFSIIIEAYSKLLADYETSIEKFESSGGSIIIKHTNKAKETNLVKNPFYLAIETMRLQILKYSNELGLSPAGLKKINEKSLGDKKESALAKALSKLE